MVEEKPLLLLVDGHSLAFRSFYAFAKGGEGGLSTKAGVPTSVTYGFLKALLDNCKGLSPQGVVIAFDTAEPTFRHLEDANYKAHRDEAPQHFFEDLANLQSILAEALDLALCLAPGFEADDVLGTLANQAADGGWRVRILSGDRDLFQLVDDERDIAVLYMGGGPYAKNSGPSEIRREQVIARLGVPPDQIRVIPNGIRPPVRPDAGRIARWRAAWGLTDCARVLGAVGRLDPQKGFDRLLALLPDLARQVPAGERWGLVILGEGAERPRLEALARQAPADRLVVCLPGYRSDAAACIGAFDLFVMPSRYEGYGLTLAEAMAHGVPILASTADSLPELLAGYPGGRCLAGEAWTGAILAESAQLARGEPRLSHTVDDMCAAYAALYAAL